MEEELELEQKKAKKKAIIFAGILAAVATVGGLTFLLISGGPEKKSVVNLPEEETIDSDTQGVVPPESSGLPSTSQPTESENQTERPDSVKTPVYPLPSPETPAFIPAEDPALKKLQQQYLNQLEKLIYGKQNTGQDLSKLEPLVAVSPMAGKITIRSVARSANDDLQNEYVVLSATKNLPNYFLLTGLKIRSLSSGQEITIGEGVYLPFSNQINYKENIFIGPGATVYVISGQSPVGYSFRPNQCSGYWSQFQKFTPAIRLSCPKIIYEQPAELPLVMSDACFSYLNKMAVCRIHTDKSTDPEVMVKDPYYQLPAECRQFIERTSGYNNCVNLNKNNSDFYSNEWRVYLGRTSKAWKAKREIVQLLDTNGKVIAQYSY